MLGKHQEDWNITLTVKHWANEKTTKTHIEKTTKTHIEKTTKTHIEKVLIPYMKQCRMNLSLSHDHKAFVIFDKFRGQCKPNAISLLKNNQ